jgi:hypothetical protein
VSQVLWQSTAIVLGMEDNPSYEAITSPRTLSHVFSVPSHLPSAFQSKHKSVPLEYDGDFDLTVYHLRRAQVIWKLVFKIYRKSGAFKRWCTYVSSNVIVTYIIFQESLLSTKPSSRPSRATCHSRTSSMRLRWLSRVRVLRRIYLGRWWASNFVN